MDEPLAKRFGPRLGPDSRRVIAKLFVPGEEHPDSASRTQTVVERVLEMPEEQVRTVLADVLAAFAHRHRDYTGILRASYGVVSHRLPDPASLSDERMLLLGAYFTHEYSIEAAALFNPSMVPHPDQSGLRPGETRFMMSLRAVGEGHLSAVEFRSGVVGPGMAITIDEPGTLCVVGAKQPTIYDRESFQVSLDSTGADEETVISVLSMLPESFDYQELSDAVDEVHPYIRTRAAGQGAIDHIRALARAHYDVAFPADTLVGERVLWPSAANESHGMEDVRLVRFTDDDGEVTYYGTYTAFDGVHIAPAMLETKDFVHFSISPSAGPAAQNKGMALFPRKVGGRYMALSRWDRENVSLAYSEDGRVWQRGPLVSEPASAWESINTGNCGSPIETPEGWLFLTHGVGPMRSYAIGAVLLDLDDPAKIRATMRDPLLTADASEREGYVPNVVYSCGGLYHGDTFTLPYGVSDATIGFCQIHVPTLIERMLADL